MFGGRLLLLQFMYSQKMYKTTFKKETRECSQCGKTMTSKTRPVFGTAKIEGYFECSFCGHFEKDV